VHKEFVTVVVQVVRIVPPTWVMVAVTVPPEGTVETFERLRDNSSPAVPEKVKLTDSFADKLIVTGTLFSANAATKKFAVLVPVPFALTTATEPVVAPFGTITCKDVAVAARTVAAIPLNVTLLLLVVAPNPLPLMVIDVPTGAEEGLNDVMVTPEVAELAFERRLPSES